VRRPSEFIIPCSPTLRARPPTGEAWLHEIKFDGWRIQLHKRGGDVALYTKNGHDYTKRLPSIAAAVAELPARSAIIDGELTAIDERGRISARSISASEKSNTFASGRSIYWNSMGATYASSPSKIASTHSKISSTKPEISACAFQRASTTPKGSLLTLKRPGRHRVEGPRSPLPLRPLRLGQSEVPRLARRKPRPPRFIQKASVRNASAIPLRSIAGVRGRLCCVHSTLE
jgi:hypothetical protein